MRTPRAGDAFTFGEGVGLGDGVVFGVGDAVGEALDLGDSCAIATETNAKPSKIAVLTFFVIVAARIISAIVVAPVHVREKVVAPFAVAQKFFIDVVRCKLIVQSIETNKMIHRSLRGVILCRSRFHQKRPVA